MNSIITSKNLKDAIHPKESSRFILALIVCIPVVFIGLILVLNITRLGGYELMLILFVILSLTFGVWFTLSILKANLIGNSVRVSENNFPEIHKIYLEVKEILDYKKDVPIYIVQGGDINAFISKFFRIKFIILNSSLVEEMIEKNGLIQMKWIIARFIGALKVKHFRLTLLRVLVDSIEKIKIFNIFLLPYERATQYSGDNIGLLVCNNLVESLTAFDKFLVGNKLAGNINIKGILEQGKDVSGSFFSFLARIVSTHPHTVSRHLNLLAFAQWKFPEAFEKYVLANSNMEELRPLLPNYYANRIHIETQSLDTEQQ